jgi:hypothetical protein
MLASFPPGQGQPDWPPARAGPGTFTMIVVSFTPEPIVGGGGKAGRGRGPAAGWPAAGRDPGARPEAGTSANWPGERASTGARGGTSEATEPGGSRRADGRGCAPAARSITAAVFPGNCPALEAPGLPATGAAVNGSGRRNLRRGRPTAVGDAKADGYQTAPPPGFPGVNWDYSPASGSGAVIAVLVTRRQALSQWAAGDRDAFRPRACANGSTLRSVERPMRRAGTWLLRTGRRGTLGPASADHPRLPLAQAQSGGPNGLAPTPASEIFRAAPVPGRAFSRRRPASWRLAKARARRIPRHLDAVSPARESLKGIARRVINDTRVKTSSLCRD